MRKVRRFTREEDAFITGHIGRLGDAEIARHLGRHPRSVSSRARTLALPRDDYTFKPFSTEDDAVIRSSEGKLAGPAVAKLLGRSPTSVYGRARKLGIVFKRSKRQPRSRLTNRGYVRIRVEVGGKLRWVHEHTWMVTQALGRSLSPGEQIHHIDFDKTNNRSDNLYLCGSGAEHSKAHSSLTRLVKRLLERGVIRFNAAAGGYEPCETIS